MPAIGVGELISGDRCRPPGHQPFGCQLFGLRQSGIGRRLPKADRLVAEKLAPGGPSSEGCHPSPELDSLLHKSSAPICTFAPSLVQPSGLRYVMSGVGAGARKSSGPEPVPEPEHLNQAPDGRDPRPESIFLPQPLPLPQNSPLHLCTVFSPALRSQVRVVRYRCRVTAPGASAFQVSAVRPSAIGDRSPAAEGRTAET